MCHIFMGDRETINKTCLALILYQNENGTWQFTGKNKVSSDVYKVYFEYYIVYHLSSSFSQLFNVIILLVLQKHVVISDI